MKLKLNKILIIISLLIISCSSHKKHEIKIATGSPGGTYIIVGDAFNQSLNSEVLKFMILKGSEYHSISNIDLVSKHQVDFALTQNDIPNDSNSKNIRVVMPLYTHNLYIIYKPGSIANSLKELVTGRRIGIGPKNGGSALFIMKVFEKFGIKPSEYIPVYCSHDCNMLSDSIDVSCLLAGFNNPRISELLINEHGKLLSLDSYDMLNKGSSVEGFCASYYRAKPYLISKYTYSNYPDNPVLTLGIDIILITNKDTPDDIVYELTKTICDSRSILANTCPLLSNISENFEQSKLNYQIHPGALQFFERNKPSFFEKHSDMIGLLLTFAGMLAAILSAFIKWTARKRKNRIDTYYQKVLNIDSELSHELTSDNIKCFLDELEKIKIDAYDKLIKEKLEANESFRIFVTLLNDTRVKLLAIN